MTLDKAAVIKHDKTFENENHSQLAVNAKKRGATTSFAL